jgi:hypothetical protein
MKGYRFTNNTMEVGVGSNVTFHNLDSDQHTASAVNYISGTTKGADGPVFDVKVPEGEFVARVFMSDGKGGKATASYGLKGSSDAPDTKKTWTHSADPQALNDVVRTGQTQSYEIGNIPYDFNLESLILTFADTPAQNTNQVNITLNRFSVEPAVNTPELQCPLKHESGMATLGPCFVKSNLPAATPTAAPEKFFLNIHADQGAIANWKADLNAFQFTAPGFGDYNAVRCHIHGAVVHCF